MIEPSNTPMYFSGFRINLRDAGNVDANIVATAYGNEEATVLFTNENWAYISYQGENYFVDKGFLSFAPSNTEETAKVFALVKGQLYSEPTSECTEKQTIYGGMSVGYCGRYFDSSYYVVRYQNQTWYLYTEQNIDEVLKNDISDFMLEGEFYTVSTSVNMRTLPESNAEVIRLIRKGETVQMLILPNQNSNWCLIKTANDEIGFTSFSSLQPVETSTP